MVIFYVKEHHEEVLRQHQILLGQLEQALMEPQDGSSDEFMMRGKEAHILVVDDDSMNLRVAEKMLEERYVVSCVKSGEETLEFLEKKFRI